MRTTKQYSPELPRRIFRSELTHCLSCGTRLRRSSTVSRRIIITQQGPVRVTHCGYRCPTAACPTAGRTYRSTLADTLALPGFTFGLDWVLLVGHLRLAEHLTLDQTYRVVQERLARWQLSISRREILYLFDAYCTLFRAAQEWRSAPPWRQELLAQGGVILAIDGIQPDKGNETIYLVRDVLTGRLLAAENLLASETQVLCEQLLAPLATSLATWDLPVLGVVTDGQESLRQAVAAIWPEVPHQVCQFHALREAGRLLYERDRAVKVQLRKAVQDRIRVVRRQLERTVPEEPHAAEQVQILAEYAAGIQAIINRDGLQPFRFAALAIDEALGAVDQSLAALEKKGALTDWLANRLARLRTIVQVRHDWAADLACLRQCHTWLLHAEALLNPLRDPPVTDNAVASWLASVEQLPEAARLPPLYATCLHHFIGVLHRLQPYLLSWTQEARLPRTNNDLERFIRALKTRYRRISGRKNWNAYLLRYGRRTAFYEDAVQHQDAACLLEQRLRSLAAACWGPARRQQRPLDLRLRTQFHFLHPRAQTLRLLEQRWSQTTGGT